MWGHTHDQYYSTYQSVTNPSKTIGVGQVGASGTTYENDNPSYALIDIDAETLLPVNYRIFAFDLTEANANGDAQPNWRLFTDYTQDYGLAGGVSTDSLYDLAVRLTQDKDLYEQFVWDKTRRVGNKKTVTHFETKSRNQFCHLTTIGDKQFNECDGKTNGNSPIDDLIGKWKVTGRQTLQ